MSRILNERVIASAILLMIGLGLAISTIGLEFSNTNPAFNPMFFPRIILTLWVMLAFSNVIADLLLNEPSDPIRLGRIIIISLAVIAYALYMREGGFFLSSVGLSLIVLIVSGVRKITPLVLVGVGLPLLIAILFNHILKMPLPNSPLFWWI